MVMRWPWCSKWGEVEKNFQNMYDIIWFIYEKLCTCVSKSGRNTGSCSPLWVDGGKEHVVVRCWFLCIFCGKFTKIMIIREKLFHIGGNIKGNDLCLNILEALSKRNKCITEISVWVCLPLFFYWGVIDLSLPLR